jgi:hypothetical protein
MKALLYPLLIQVALTFVVMFRMYSTRVAEFKAKRIDPNSVPTRRQFAEKITDSARAADNFANLFEMPVLFYIAILLALTLLIHDPIMIALAWLYVGLRIIHSLIHCTYNLVMHRFAVFACSALVLMGLWVRLGWIIIIR